jgi:hypothetical protein
LSLIEILSRILELPDKVQEPARLQCSTQRLSSHISRRRHARNAQACAHENPRTTKQYDRTGEEITRDEIERSLGCAESNCGQL